MREKSNKSKLTKSLTSAEFKEYYFLKEEIKDFCRKEGLKVSGSKNQLEERIVYYLDTGKSLEDSKFNSNPNSKYDNSKIKAENSKIKTKNSKIKAKNSKIKAKNSKIKAKNSKIKTENSKIKSENTHTQEITLDSTIGENFKCSEDKREFFKNEIGKGFKFKVKFQKWLKDNPDKTYQDAINAYHEIQNQKEKTDIGNQFQYNQYIRDFFEDNEGKTLDDAIKCWNYKKSLKGHNKYEESDLNILN